MGNDEKTTIKLLQCQIFIWLYWQKRFVDCSNKLCLYQ